MAKVPQYIQLANELRKDILSGKYGTEGGLPGVEELKRRSELSINTIYRALSLLAGEKLIVERDRNYFVNPPITTIMTQYIPPLVVSSALQGRKAYYRNIAAPVRMKLPSEIADRYGMDHDVDVVFRDRVGVEQFEQHIKPFKLVKHYYVFPLSDVQIRRMSEDANADILAEIAPFRLHETDDISSRMTVSSEIALLELTEPMPITQKNIIMRNAANENIILIQEVVVLDEVSRYDYFFENRP
jgi:hypothetical protein